MANLRVIKKDVIFFTNEVISDCCTHIALYPERDSAEIESIINDAIALGDATFDRINHFSKGETKKYFKEVNEDFFKGVDALYTRLSEENKKPCEAKEKVQKPVKEEVKKAKAPQTEATAKTEKVEKPKTVKKAAPKKPAAPKTKKEE